jgi:hypothetical protein
MPFTGTTRLKESAAKLKVKWFYELKTSNKVTKEKWFLLYQANSLDLFACNTNI